jgi:hypothetical protein
MPAKRRLRAILLGLLGVLIAIQFIQPRRTNPLVVRSREVLARTQIPVKLAAVLQRCCYDCHSHQTRWPWYSHVAPVCWLVVNDVKEARSSMNFSDWAAYEPREAAKRLEGICEEIRKGEMPLSIYLRMHHDARLTAQEITELCAWTAGELARLGGVGALGGTTGAGERESRETRSDH